MLGSGMPILNAVGSSLFSVGAFGLTTAINYAVSGLVDWRIALEFIAGGALGGLLGTRTALKLSAHKQALTYVFVAILFTVATYMWRGQRWRFSPALRGLGPIWEKSSERIRPLGNALPRAGLCLRTGTELFPGGVQTPVAEIRYGARRRRRRRPQWRLAGGTGARRGVARFSPSAQAKVSALMRELAST